MTINLMPGGLALLRKALAGQAEIRFTSVKIGNGDDAGSSASTMSNPLLSARINAIEIADGFVTLHTTYDNAQMDSPFHATEIGLWAAETENGEEALYAYGFTERAKADYIPAHDERLYEASVDVLIYVGQTENVTANIASSLTYATREEFDAFTERRDNPHGVTAAQVGLGHVPNVTTNDQTPSYENRDQLEGLVSGEKLGIAMGKIKAAVAALIGHLQNRNNPHGVTCADISAAEETHTHSAADINKGILPITRGGTGVNSTAALGELAAQNIPAHTFVSRLAFGGVTVPVAAWTRDDGKTEFSYYADIPCEGVSSEDVGEVVFDESAATGGNLSPLCDTREDAVRIWANAPEATVILAIHVWRC